MNLETDLPGDHYLDNFERGGGVSSGQTPMWYGGMVAGFENRPEPGPLQAARENRARPGT